MIRSRRLTALQNHVARLRRCRRCPLVIPPPVSGGPIISDVMIIGQAPGVREPVLKRPFAHTAGKTLFRWFEGFGGRVEKRLGSGFYFAAFSGGFRAKAVVATIRFPTRRKFGICCSGWMTNSWFS